MQAQLAHHTLKVSEDGRLFDAHLFSYGFLGVAFHEQRHDLPLSVREHDSQRHRVSGGAGG